MWTRFKEKAVWEHSQFYTSVSHFLVNVYIMNSFSNYRYTFLPLWEEHSDTQSGCFTLGTLAVGDRAHLLSLIACLCLNMHELNVVTGSFGNENCRMTSHHTAPHWTLLDETALLSWAEGTHMFGLRSQWFRWCNGGKRAKSHMQKALLWEQHSLIHSQEVYGHTSVWQHPLQSWQANSGFIFCGLSLKN